MFVYLQNKSVSIESTSSKNLYKHLIEIKYERPMIEKRWCRNFNISGDLTNWKSIYSRKVCNVKLRNLEQFNYKLLHNILLSGSMLHRWKQLLQL